MRHAGLKAITVLVLFARFADVGAQDAALGWEGFIPIGGIEQWIAIRGESPANPVILYLHGGPGEALSPFLSLFDPWLEEFTVVVWDQRGSGRTYGRNPSAPAEMTLDRLTQDAIEVAEYARSRLGKEKLVLVGQSWGSMIGLSAAARRPNLFHAYVGTGQSVSWSRTVAGQEAFARSQARAADDRAALEAIDQARDAPLFSFERTAPFRPWIMPPSDTAFIEMQRAYVGPEPIPQQGEVWDWVRGFGFSAQALGPEILRFDAYDLGLDWAIPIVVIQGRDDHVTPYEAAERFVQEIRAPAKRFVAVDGGHFACYTNGDAFVSALVENVIPLIE